MTDDNGEMKTTYYEDGKKIDGLAESEFLNDVDLLSDGSPNTTDQDIQSETKNKTQNVDNKNSGLTKARKDLTRVEDDRLMPEGDLVNSSQLTSKGRSFIKDT